MAWLSMGEGDRVALAIPGGPGNSTPNLSSVKPLSGLVDAGYRVVCVARRRNMPQGHSVEDMARDYAELIATEFNGKVDLIIGSSYGGIVSQYIAAEHDHCFDHIVVHVAACQVHPESVMFDYRFAKAINEGKLFQAGMIMAAGLYAGARLRWIMQIVLGAYVWFVARSEHDTFASDTLVEGEAERNFDSRAVLPDIKVPVLLIAGGADIYFPMDLTLETASLIPDCHLRLYEGQGHVEAALDKRVCPDILDFINAQNAT